MKHKIVFDHLDTGFRRYGQRERLVAFHEIATSSA